MTPELVMLVGIPGCGKSTWIENFLKGNDRMYSIISSDYLIQKAADECGVTYDVAHELIPKEEVAAKVFGKVAFCVRSDYSMIWDQTNLSVADRRMKLQSIPFHWKRRCIAFELSVEEVKRRRDGREATNPGKTIPSDVIELMNQAYERPTAIEGWDEITIITS